MAPRIPAAGVFFSINGWKPPWSVGPLPGQGRSQHSMLQRKGRAGSCSPAQLPSVLVKSPEQGLGCTTCTHRRGAGQLRVGTGRYPEQVMSDHVKSLSEQAPRPADSAERRNILQRGF